MSLQVIFGSFLCCIAVLQLAILYVLHAGQQQAQQRAHDAMHRPQFILFGDSITQHSFDEGGVFLTPKVNCSSIAAAKMLTILKMRHDRRDVRRWVGCPACQPLPEEGESP